MGMYTGLRVTAYIKPEYMEMIDEVTRGEEWNSFDYRFLDNFKNLPRTSAIPFGAIAYMPDDWENKNFFNLKQGVWIFECSLKNYHAEIDIFLEEVLPEISISGAAERLYEEELVSALFEVVDGRLIKTRSSEIGRY